MITTKIATLNDAGLIRSIGRKSFADAFREFFHQAKDLEDYLDRTYITSRITSSIAKPNNLLFTSYYHNEPAGFAKMKKHSLHPALNSESQSELQKIYVLKQFHGTGVAQALMDKVISTARQFNTGELWLDVLKENSRATRFYLKNGFVKRSDHSFKIGSQLFHYDVMALSIHSS